jgi:hypothetical protein
MSVTRLFRIRGQYETKHSNIEVRILLPETWILYLLCETSVEEVLNETPYSIMSNGSESG